MRTVQHALGPSIDAQQGLVAFAALDRLEVAVEIDHLAGLVVGTVLVAYYLEDLAVDQTFVVVVDNAVHNRLDLVAGIVRPGVLAVGTVLVACQVLAAYCLEDLVGIDLEEAFVD